MSQLPTGVYRPGKSIIHGLDAAVKLLCFIMLTLAVLFTDTGAGYVMVLPFTFAVAYLAQISRRDLARMLKGYAWLFFLVIVLNTLFYMPETAFFRRWFIMPSAEGLKKGLIVCLKMASVLLLSNAVSRTTPPLRLTGAMETLLSPLKLIGLPAAHIAAMLSVAVRLIPSLSDDADNIRAAQLSRGISFDNAGFLKKARASLPMTVPLIVSAFRRADRLSMAMESRGYSVGGGGMGIRGINAAAADWAALLVCAALCALQIIVF